MLSGRGRVARPVISLPQSEQKFRIDPDLCPLDHGGERKDKAFILRCTISDLEVQWKGGFGPLPNPSPEGVGLRREPGDEIGGFGASRFFFSLPALGEGPGMGQQSLDEPGGGFRFRVMLSGRGRVARPVISLPRSEQKFRIDPDLCPLDHGGERKDKAFILRCTISGLKVQGKGGFGELRFFFSLPALGEGLGMGQQSLTRWVGVSGYRVVLVSSDAVGGAIPPWVPPVSLNCLV
jgi:hypothetical protein